MGVIEQSLIAFILSIDSFFVMAYVALSNSNLKIEKPILIFSIITLAVIQTLLAFLGITIGARIITWVQDWDHWVVFLFFSYLAWKQWSFDPKLITHTKKINHLSIILLALAWSVDAFVVSLQIQGTIHPKAEYQLYLGTIL